MFSFTKNAKIDEIVFENKVQYKETTVEQIDTIRNDQYKFYENGELVLENDYIKKPTEISDEPIGNSKRVSKNTSRENQASEVIELSSDEENLPKIIKLSSDEENLPEIIELSSDE
ncbi:26335_t:CDS:1, partial [Racocetra persica]